jgi:hypothetical protein
MGLARRAVVAMAAAVLPVLLAACGAGDPPELRLRADIESLQAAIEAREGDRIGDFLAADFIGPQAMDRDGALRMARLAFLRYRAVGVSVVGPLDVEMQGRDHARVRFDAALTGGSGALLPDSARVWSVDTGWRLEDGDWRNTSATWEPRL